MQPCRRPPLAHLQGTSPDVLHEVVVAKDSYETPSWVWSHYVKSEALTVDVHASAFNAVAPRYITKADGPASLDEPLPRAKKVGAWPLSPPLPQLGTLYLVAQLPSSRHRMHGVGLWLNPAYGSKCKGIEPTLARCVRAVRERGCWLVALLPSTLSRRSELLCFKLLAPAPCAQAPPFIVQVPHVRAARARSALPARQGGVP